MNTTPRLAPYPLVSDRQLLLDDAAVSFDHNLSLLSTADLLMYSRTVDSWQPLPMASSVRRIVGCGNSPLVAYDGTGAYFVDIAEDHVDIVMDPDATFVRPHWKPASGTPRPVVCKLDRAAKHTFKLRVAPWDGAVQIQRLDSGPSSTTVAEGNQGFSVTPGHYRLLQPLPSDHHKLD